MSEVKHIYNVNIDTNEFYERKIDTFTFSGGKDPIYHKTRETQY